MAAKYQFIIQKKFKVMGMAIFRPSCGTETLKRILMKLGIYAVSQKKGATQTMAITLSILDGFAKFFHCCKQQ